MAEVARLVGMEKREYMDKDKKPRVYCGLHLVYVEDSQRGVQGSKVEAVSCPRDLDPALLEMNHLYQLDYEMYDTRNGKAARLVDLIPVEG